MGNVSLRMDAWYGGCKNFRLKGFPANDEGSIAQGKHSFHIPSWRTRSQGGGWKTVGWMGVCKSTSCTCHM